MNNHGYSNRRLLTHLGESTSNMLTFQDMMENTQKESGRPPLRMYRSMEQAPVKNHPNNMRKKTHADICLPPLDRGVRKSYSSPPVLSPRQDEIEWQRRQVDVTPGYSVPLCGALETMHAFQKGRIVHTECASCKSFLYCIDSVRMVLCPTCRSISPVEANTSNRNVAESLGLGLTVEHLIEELEK